MLCHGRNPRSPGTIAPNPDQAPGTRSPSHPRNGTSLRSGPDTAEGRSAELTPGPLSRGSSGSPQRGYPGTRCCPQPPEPARPECRCAAGGRPAPQPAARPGVVTRVVETPWTGSATRDAVRHRGAECRADAGLHGRGEPAWTGTGLLITQRSRVQIPPPLPRPEALSRTEKGPSACGLLTDLLTKRPL